MTEPLLSRFQDTVAVMPRDRVFVSLYTDPIQERVTIYVDGYAHLVIHEMESMSPDGSPVFSIEWRNALFHRMLLDDHAANSLRLQLLEIFGHAVLEEHGFTMVPW